MPIPGRLGLGMGLATYKVPGIRRSVLRFSRPSPVQRRRLSTNTNPTQENEHSEQTQIDLRPWSCHREEWKGLLLRERGNAFRWRFSVVHDPVEVHSHGYLPPERRGVKRRDIEATRALRKEGRAMLRKRGRNASAPPGHQKTLRPPGI